MSFAFAAVRRFRSYASEFSVLDMAGSAIASFFDRSARTRATETAKVQRCSFWSAFAGRPL